MKRLALTFVLCLLAGVSVGAELDETVTLAERGDASAQTRLASMYKDGEGLPTDYTKAAQLLSEIKSRKSQG